MHEKQATNKPREIEAHHAVWWVFVVALTGVDYFSTLGYQPSIAWEAAGRLAPLATAVIVFMTLFGALPIYCWVARSSSDGSGSIGMIERMYEGSWRMKVVMLTLLGAAMTDFIITITLSAADAAAHLVENPRWEELLVEVGHLDWKHLLAPVAVIGTVLALSIGWRRTIWCVVAAAAGLVVLRVAGTLPKEGQQLLLTQSMILALGVVFWIGFREAISIAVVLVVVYLTLNSVINGAGTVYILRHPQVLVDWWGDVHSGNWRVQPSHLPFGAAAGLVMALLTSLLLFPKLALGLSGFETGVSVMPLIKGEPTDTPEKPTGRIRATWKLLAAAAAIMSVMLIASSMTVTCCISPEAFEVGASPTAKDRALAFIAHGQTGLPLCPLFGEIFGTVYDISTVLILWFAGASAKAGLINLVPKYLPRHGMAPEWAKAHRPLVVAFTAIAIVVTFIFNASVSAQSDAYATGVLILMSSACLAVSMQLSKTTKEEPRRGWWRALDMVNIWYVRLVAAVFVFTTSTVIMEKPVGLVITCVFTIATFIVAFTSRIARSRELRFTEFHFESPTARLQWGDICSGDGAPLRILVPHRPSGHPLAEKERLVRAQHRLPPEAKLVFLEVGRGDTSQFINAPLLSISIDDGGNDRIVIKATEAASVSHTIAAIVAAMSQQSRVEVFFGWSRGNPLYLAIDFVLFGEGNIPERVNFLLSNMTFEEGRRPVVTISSAG
jgi:hypothetical protein